MNLVPKYIIKSIRVLIYEDLLFFIEVVDSSKR